MEQSCVKSNIVLSEGSCTGKLRAVCPTVGAVGGKEARSRTEMQIVTGNTKGAGIKPAPKVLDL